MIAWYVPSRNAYRIGSDASGKSKSDAWVGVCPGDRVGFVRLPKSEQVEVPSGAWRDVDAGNWRAITMKMMRPAKRPTADRMPRTGGQRVRVLVGIRSDHDHVHVPFIGLAAEADRQRTQLSGGDATLLSSHAGDPDRRRATESKAVSHDDDNQPWSQPAAGPALPEPPDSAGTSTVTLNRP
jgi:hypothetical protein